LVANTRANQSYNRGYNRSAKERAYSQKNAPVKTLVLCYNNMWKNKTSVFPLNLYSDNGQLDQFRLIRNRANRGYEPGSNQRAKNALVSDLAVNQRSSG
jgi:hypothetical protein